MTYKRIFEKGSPYPIIEDWLAEAKKTEINDPNAISLATVGADGLPNVRIVLLKEIDPQGFTFYTNYKSQKAMEIAENDQAAFVLHWKSLRRQIRVRGQIQREDGPQADRYFASRSLDSQLGAWASRQSTTLDARSTLEEKVSEMAIKFGKKPSRPPFWGGYRIKPTEIEFWCDGAARLHDRARWTKEETGGWKISRLYP